MHDNKTGRHVAITAAQAGQNCGNRLCHVVRNTGLMSSHGCGQWLAVANIKCTASQQWSQLETDLVCDAFYQWLLLQH